MNDLQAIGIDIEAYLNLEAAKSFYKETESKA